MTPEHSPSPNADRDNQPAKKRTTEQSSPSRLPLRKRRRRASLPSGCQAEQEHLKQDQAAHGRSSPADGLRKSVRGLRGQASGDTRGEDKEAAAAAAFKPLSRWQGGESTTQLARYGEELKPLPRWQGGESTAQLARLGEELQRRAAVRQQQREAELSPSSDVRDALLGPPGLAGGRSGHHHHHPGQQRCALCLVPSAYLDEVGVCGTCATTRGIGGPPGIGIGESLRVFPGLGRSSVHALGFDLGLPPSTAQAQVSPVADSRSHSTAADGEQQQQQEEAAAAADAEAAAAAATGTGAIPTVAGGQGKAGGGGGDGGGEGGGGRGRKRRALGGAAEEHGGGGGGGGSLLPLPLLIDQLSRHLSGGTQTVEDRRSLELLERQLSDYNVRHSLWATSSLNSSGRATGATTMWPPLPRSPTAEELGSWDDLMPTPSLAEASRRSGGSSGRRHAAAGSAAAAGGWALPGAGRCGNPLLGGNPLEGSGCPGWRDSDWDEGIPTALRVALDTGYLAESLAGGGGGGGGGGVVPMGWAAALGERRSAPAAFGTSYLQPPQQQQQQQQQQHWGAVLACQQAAAERGSAAAIGGGGPRASLVPLDGTSDWYPNNPNPRRPPPLGPGGGLGEGGLGLGLDSALGGGFDMHDALRMTSRFDQALGSGSAAALASAALAAAAAGLRGQHGDPGGLEPGMHSGAPGPGAPGPGLYHPRGDQAHTPSSMGDDLLGPVGSFAAAAAAAAAAGPTGSLTRSPPPYGGAEAAAGATIGGDSAGGGGDGGRASPWPTAGTAATVPSPAGSEHRAAAPRGKGGKGGGKGSKSGGSGKGGVKSVKSGGGSGSASGDCQARAGTRAGTAGGGGSSQGLAGVPPPGSPFAVSGLSVPQGAAAAPCTAPGVGASAGGGAGGLQHTTRAAHFHKRMRPLEMLLSSGLLKEGDELVYKTKSGQIKATGEIRGNGILCYSCNQIVGCTEFEKCAGSALRRPTHNIYDTHYGLSIFELMKRLQNG